MVHILFKDGLEFNTVEEVLFVLVFFILDLDVEYALLKFRKCRPNWLTLLDRIVPGRNLDVIKKRFSPCSKYPSVTCFHCMALKAAQQLFNPNLEHIFDVIAIGDSMARGLENVVQTTVLTGARLREIVRCV